LEKRSQKNLLNTVTGSSARHDCRNPFELGLRQQFGLSDPTNSRSVGNEGPKPEETAIDA
jgi:hypothetical protein